MIIFKRQGTYLNGVDVGEYGIKTYSRLLYKVSMEGELIFLASGKRDQVSIYSLKNKFYVFESIGLEEDRVHSFRTEMEWRRRATEFVGVMK